jgi:hypothetical protein
MSKTEMLNLLKGLSLNDRIRLVELILAELKEMTAHQKNQDDIDYLRSVAGEWSEEEAEYFRKAILD